MTPDDILAKMQAEFPKIEKSAVQVKDPSRDALVPLATWLKKEGFDYLDMLTAVDYLGPVDMKGYIRQQNFNVFQPEGAAPQAAPAPAAGYAYRPVLELVWAFVSIKDKARVFVTLEVARDGAGAPSLSGLFKSADWQEREVFDLFGVVYEGHPNLTKILTPDFLKGHPLRKDYVHVKDRYDD